MSISELVLVLVEKLIEDEKKLVEIANTQNKENED